MDLVMPLVIGMIGSRKSLNRLMVFEIGTAKPLPYTYLGLQITAESPRGFAINQSVYAMSIQEVA